MRRICLSTALLGAALLVLVAGCGGSSSDATSQDGTTTTNATGAAAAGSLPATPRTQAVFGKIVWLRRTGGQWRLRFDPALFLTGVTANVAAAEDGVVAPGKPVPNDSYTVDESKRRYTYRVAPDAKVVVLTRTDGDLGSTRITVARLAQVLGGKSGLELYEPLSTGVWLTVRIDTVHAIVHQYRP